VDLAGIGAYASAFDDRLGRWQDELARAGVRTTLWFGVMHQIAEGVEGILQRAAQVLASQAPDVVTAALERSAGGRGLDRLTLGETVKLIEQANKVLRPSDGGRLADRSELSLLDRISKMRNAVAHGRYHPQIGQPALGAAAFLQAARELCISKFVGRLDDLEAERSTLKRRDRVPRSFEVADIVPAPPNVQRTLVTGRRYLYTEDEDRLEVRLVADSSGPDFVAFEISVTKVLSGDPRHLDQTYVVTMKRGIRFAGMWELHPLDN